jgi:hypothetical protein
LVRSKRLLLLLVVPLLPLAAVRRPAGNRPAPGQALTRRYSRDEPLSKASLKPPLQSQLRALRFSPDGKYILLQDEIGIFIFTRDPLAAKFWLDAPDALPAGFTADSKILVAATRALGLGRWDLSTGKSLGETTLGKMDGCLSASLSPNAEYFGCIGTGMDLHVFRTDTGAQVFTDQVLSNQRIPIGLRQFVIVPLYVGLAYSEPIGNIPSNSLKPLLEKDISWSRVIFSPDGHYVIAGNPPYDSIFVDLQSMRKTKIAGSVNAAFKHEVVFVSADQVAAVGKEKPDESVLLTFPGGEEITRLGFEGSATATSRPGCLIQWDKDGTEGTIVDVNSRRALSRVSRFGGDVFDDTVVALTEDGDLVLSRLGADPRITKLRMVTSPLPLLRTAVAPPGLETIALAVRGQGGVFRVRTGERIARFDQVRGGWCENDHSCLLRVGRKSDLGTKVEGVEAETGASSAAWSRPFSKDKPEEDYFSGEVLLSRTSTPGILMGPQAGPTPFVFGALDAKTGKQLWTRKFEGDAPIPFTDPQGTRVVLAWEAKSSAARAAAKHYPDSWDRFKGAKLSKKDTYFEVLAARSGTELGGVLLQSGAGPESFSSAFSAGDWLVIVKDGTRVNLISLSTWEEKMHLFGSFPALSSEGDLMALETKSGVVTVYEPKTGAKRRELRLPDRVVYLRFSGDGRRLLALTANQTVYVFDVSETTAAINP